MLLNLIETVVLNSKELTFDIPHQSIPQPSNNPQQNHPSNRKQRITIKSLLSGRLISYPIKEYQQLVDDKA
jgi:hypothetical protein